jgi:Phage integrase, N-terminal SAM-like domain
MQTTLKAVVESYLRSKSLSRGTRNEYFSTLRKWAQWGGGAPIEELRRKDVREFLDWVYELAVAHEGTNPGRTANKAREHLRAVISWAWEQELIDAPPLNISCHYSSGKPSALSDMVLRYCESSHADRPRRVGAPPRAM